MEVKLSNKDVWAICYINRDHLYRVEKDLSRDEKYKGVEAYIPTVRILRKQFKGKDIFEEVPLLFNYGFFKIPRKKLTIEFLSQMREDIMCIHAWIKDSKKVIKTKPSLTEGNEPLVIENLIPVAMATSWEISRIIEAHDKFSIYDKNDIDNLKEGMYINLKGYPFDGMDAKVISVDKKKEKVKIELVMEGLLKDALVSFDNVFYTVYHGVWDEKDFKEKSLDEIQSRGKNSGDKYMSDEH